MTVSPHYYFALEEHVVAAIDRQGKAACDASKQGKRAAADSLHDNRTQTCTRWRGLTGQAERVTPSSCGLEDASGRGQDRVAKA